MPIHPPLVKHIDPFNTGTTKLMTLLDKEKNRAANLVGTTLRLATNVGSLDPEGLILTGKEEGL